MAKITFNDKSHILPYGTREVQVQDLDINEIKTVVNANADTLDANTTDITNLKNNQYTGVETYATKADLPATGTLLVSYKVTNDTTTSNNGYWHWNGTVYVKDANIVNGVIASGNVDAINGDTAYNVTNYKADRTVGKNLLDFSKATIDWRVSVSTGELISGVGYNTSDYIPIIPSTDYAYTRFTWIAYYDADKVFVSGTTGTGTTDTSPIGAYYLRYTDNSSKLSATAQMELGTVPTTFEAYELLTDIDQIRDFDASVVNSNVNNGFVKPIIGKNLYNKATNTIDSRISTSTGSVIADVGYQLSDYIEVLPSTLYQITRLSFITYYDSNKTFVSGASGIVTSFTTPASIYYIRFSDINSEMTGENQLELGATPTTYEDWAINFLPQYIPDINKVTTTIITAARYGSADYVGRRAIQDAIDSITDATSLNRYIIKVSAGVYEAVQTADFDKNDYGYCFIQGKSHVDIVGVGRDKVIISGYLPNNLGAGFSYSAYQTIHWEANDALLDGVTVTGENLRYPIHIDSGQTGNKDYIQLFKNLKVEHKGNTGDAVNWASYHPIGLGTSDGQNLTVENSILKAPDWAVYSHTNQNFSNKSIVKYSKCSFETKLGDTSLGIILALSLGSGVNDQFIFEDCTFDYGGVYISSHPWLDENLTGQLADHSETEILLTNNLPMVVNNSALEGYGLKITSKSSGGTSTVRFDETSTAFDTIIGNSNQAVTFINKYGRNQIYGYQYKDGGDALSGYAIGTLDIGMYLIGSNLDKYIGALGKRLGDCSTVNKTLTVIIDGTTYNIIFDKNYNGTADTVLPNYTNTQIITEITNVIGSVADVTEFISGQDYYPSFKGVKNMINADTSEVLAGMGVVFTDVKTFRKALNSDNKIDGICLDDGRINDECRIITGGEIYSDFTNQRFRIKEVTQATRLIGVELGISSTAGIFDVTASPKLLIATSTDILKIKV